MEILKMEFIRAEDARLINAQVEILKVADKIQQAASKGLTGISIPILTEDLIGELLAAGYDVMGVSNGEEYQIASWKEYLDESWAYDDVLISWELR
jgi:hypothetical protein